jgi:hypothetical protein
MKQVRCTKCSGSNYLYSDGKFIKCSKCSGNGFLLVEDSDFGADETYFKELVEIVNNFSVLNDIDAEHIAQHILESFHEKGLKVIKV